VVREIRVVAERDRYPIEEWDAATRFKDEACRGYARAGVSFAINKHAGKRNSGT